MDNFRKALIAIFTKESPQRVLDVVLQLGSSQRGRDLSSASPLGNSIPSQNFLAHTGFDQLYHYTDDEIRLIHKLAETQWMEPTQRLSISSNHVLNLIQHFSEATLCVGSDKNLCCRFEHLLRWREVTFMLGEDLFTTAYHAFHDILAHQNRQSYNWSPILRTDHRELHSMLSKGMSDNHFHLKGSSQHFELSWLYLMNDVKELTKKIGYLEKQRILNPHYSVSSSHQQHNTLRSLIIKAAAIRLCFFMNLEQPSQVMRHILLASDKETEIYLDNLQNQIASQQFHSRKFRGQYIDYAIDREIVSHSHNESDYFMQGERSILYRAFKRFYTEPMPQSLITGNLLWAYLLIRHQLRKEMMQVNKRPGFGNFSDYESRKELIIEGTIYQKILPGLAIQNSFRYQSINSLEARITPKSNPVAMSKAIDNLDKQISTDFFAEDRYKIFLDRLKCSDSNKVSNEYKHFYVTHFVKKEDKGCADKTFRPLYWLMRPRHFKSREEIRKQAISLATLRQDVSSGCNRILGIDACNSEIFARPEVFAQAYRFLRKHEPRLTNPLSNFRCQSIPRLGITYHAGEDFYGIVDGLRAIDEVLHFLEYRHGDRIGHAMALGIDPERYYNKRHNRIVTTKQNLMDDLSWLIDQIHGLGQNHFNNLESVLKDRFANLFCELYQTNRIIRQYPLFEHTTWIEYRNAWKLRGDDPGLYHNPIAIPSIHSDELLTFWRSCALNYSDDFEKHELQSIRESLMSRTLYHAYHYNPEVRSIGAEAVEFELPKHYIELVVALQNRMQQKLSTKGIGIEVCPSSNYVIARQGLYSRHPIVNYYNLGLTVDPQEIMQCSQLSVSINTDDQGVFGTSLENEYALLAIALEKEKNESETYRYKRMMILDWLDRIREKGLQQSFYDN